MAEKGMYPILRNEDYNINILGKQVYGDEPDDISEVMLNTVGAYTKRGNVRYIAYREYDEDDPASSHTSVLKVEENRVTVIQGESASRMILEQGKRHRCHYDTGVSTMTLGIFTTKLETDLADTGGKLNIKYTLDINSTLSSSNELTVEVRRRDIRQQI